MNIFTSENRTVNALSVPICFMSFYFIIVGILSFFPFFDEFDFSKVEPFLWCVVVCAFIASFATRDSKTSAVIVSAVLCSDLLCFSLCKETFGFGFSVLLSFAFSKYLGELKMKYLLPLSVGIGILSGILFGFAFPLWEKGIRTLASVISGNSFAFGGLCDAYNFMFGSLFPDLFYFKDYGGSTVINNSLVAGALNIFKASISQPLSAVSTYLTGRYFANVFLPVGIYLSLFKKIKSRFSIPLFLSLIVSVLFGNNTMFLIFIFFYNPFLFIAFAVGNALASLGSSLVDIRVGFIDNASVIEMIKYMSDVGYFLAVGLVCGALVYFISKYAVEKYDFDTYRFIPPSVKKLLDALGGAENIEKAENDYVTVYNPNLVNILKIDCEVCENKIMLSDDDLNTIKEYIN